MPNNWGGKVNVESVTATGPAATALAANINRIQAIFQNLDATNAIQLSFSDATAATTYFLLAAGARVVIDNYQGIVYSKAAAGTPSLYVCELAQ